MANFVFLTAFTGWPTVLTVVFIVVSIACSPCIYVSLRDYLENVRNRAEEQSEIIKTVVRTNWDPETFKTMEFCSICTVNFNQQD